VLHDRVKALWAAENPIYLDEQGMEALKSLTAQLGQVVIVADSYHALTAPLALEENSASFDWPARQLMTLSANAEVTTVLLHHANKSNSGGTPTTASRGSNALPAAASMTMLISWLQPPAEGQQQTDTRVMIRSQGRAKGEQVMAQLEDDGWVYLGDPQQEQQRLAREDAADELTGRAADVYDYTLDRWVNGQFSVTCNELQNQFNLERQKINRVLRGLQKRGLIEEAGTIQSAGGRPSVLYRPVQQLGGCHPEGVSKVPKPDSKGSGVFQSDGTKVSKVSKSPESDEFSSATGQTVTQGASLSATALKASPIGEGNGEGEGVLRESLNNLSHCSIKIGQPVELIQPDGSWKNGWVLSDVSSLSALTAEKLGERRTIIRNLRWEKDVRLCTTSPFASTDPVDDDAPF